jgi:glycerol-3-phosphate acyltransferase PlsX
MRVAVDAMGGDLGPPAVIDGVSAFLKEDGETALTLVGKQEVLAPLLDARGLSSHPQIKTHNATQVIEMGEKLVAVRQKRDASITRAVELLRDGEADALVAVGNTMAAVAVSTLRLRMIEGVGRPGIAIPMPTLIGDAPPYTKSNTVMIDMGANTAAKVEHLVAYAVMTSIYCEQVLVKSNPSVGLLNVGEETGKGDDFTRQAYERLSHAPVNFIGNVEGGDIYRGKCDIIVCDGFVGNSVLKASEAAAEMVVKLLKESLGQTLKRKLGAALCMSAFKELKQSIDYAEFGGAPLLGVNGIVIIGHGRSDARAFVNAFKVARDSASHAITDKIRDRLKTVDLSAHTSANGKSNVAAADRAVG